MFQFKGGSLSLEDLTKVLNKHLGAVKKTLPGKKALPGFARLGDSKEDDSSDSDFLQRFKEETEKGSSGDDESDSDSDDEQNSEDVEGQRGSNKESGSVEDEQSEEEVDGPQL